MRVELLLAQIEVSISVNHPPTAIENIQTSSSLVQPGDLYVALPELSTEFDLLQAAERGAAIIIAEKLPRLQSKEVCYLIVPNARRTWGQIAHNYFGQPSRHMQVVGVTGTNGKTTTVNLLHSLFALAGHQCGLLSTNRNVIGSIELLPTHTTAPAWQIATLMAAMVQKGCKFCFVEVSSHGICEERIAGVHFSGGIYTNLSRDHLDYHGTMDEYSRVKRRFFEELPASAFALLNIDDQVGRNIWDATSARKFSFGMAPNADFRLSTPENIDHSIEVNGYVVQTNLIGPFNAYNLTSVLGAATLICFSFDQAVQLAGYLEPVEGRMQKILGTCGRLVIVDYAHSPDALEQVSQVVRNSLLGHSARLISVFGCSGNRDRGKRAEMAEIGARLSDIAIFTSDNPRLEQVDQILSDMISGVPGELRDRIVVIEDRRVAIRRACSEAVPGDVVLITGKGHEKFQEIGRVKYEFDDVKETIKCLRELYAI